MKRFQANIELNHWKDRALMAELSANAMQKQIDVLEHKLTLMYNKNIDLQFKVAQLEGVYVQVEVPDRLDA